MTVCDSSSHCPVQGLLSSVLLRGLEPWQSHCSLHPMLARYWCSHSVYCSHSGPFPIFAGSLSKQPLHAHIPTKILGMLEQWLQAQRLRLLLTGRNALAMYNGPTYKGFFIISHIYLHNTTKYIQRTIWVCLETNWFIQTSHEGYLRKLDQKLRG